jgi:hypothetical protein
MSASRKVELLMSLSGLSLATQHVSGAAYGVDQRPVEVTINLAA